jgi:hypothetical protein
MQKKRIIWFAAVLTIVTLGYLVRSVKTSAEWDLTTDQQALRHKQD